MCQTKLHDGREPKLESRQREIVNALDRRGATQLSALFRGAIRVNEDPDFPGFVNFVAHAVREIANRLPDYIDLPFPKRVDYSGAIDRIATQWNEAANPHRATAASLSGEKSPSPAAECVFRPNPNAHFG
jgi:hypothetical protein